MICHELLLSEQRIDTFWKSVHLEEFFTTLAYEFVRIGGVAYGAIYDDYFNVIHSRVDNVEHIENLAGSKYIQSYLGDTFKSVKKDLTEKKRMCCFAERLVRWRD